MESESASMETKIYTWPIKAQTIETRQANNEALTELYKGSNEAIKKQFDDNRPPCPVVNIADYR